MIHMKSQDGVLNQVGDSPCKVDHNSKFDDFGKVDVAKITF